MKRTVTLLLLLLGSSVLFSACQKAATTEVPADVVPTEEVMVKDTGDSQVEITGSQSQTSTGGTESMEQGTTVAMTTKNFTFSVDKLTASKDSTLVVELTNTEGTHDFVIDELGVSTGILPEGKTVAVTIPTDKPGTYEYYCSIGSHRKMGMVGTITITE
jgi:plastocyanin